MARRLLTEHLIPRSDIKEEIRLIVGSNTDYITATGKVYKDYGNDMFFPKATFINKVNGYLYTNITYIDGQKQRRVHRLVAEAFLPNPNNYPVVMHKDNNKANPVLENLEWGTVAINTQNAYNDNLAHTDKSWDDSQSIPVCCFDLEGHLLQKCGSVSEASRIYGFTKRGILYQCNHLVKTKPRKGYYFRYLSEYEEKGFVL